MLAYVFWHRAAAGVAEEEYEEVLQRLHRSLAHDPPSGLTASAALRAAELPWLAGEGPGYEDWYVVEGWSALGVLETAVVSPGHEKAHHEAARRAGVGTASVYRQIEGDLEPGRARLAAWVGPPAGDPETLVSRLLGDGVSGGDGSLWRRSLVLGPAPEFCLLRGDADLASPKTGIDVSRIPHGWHVRRSARETIAAWSSAQ